jgi:hypothetical protein
MKYCECGQEMASNARICPHCGHRFTHPFVKAFAVFLAISFCVALIRTLATQNETAATAIEQPTINPALKAAPVQGAMSPQFKEQARRAFHAIERLDPDDDRDFHSQSAHRFLIDSAQRIKTPLDKKVHDILSTWLNDIDLGRMVTERNPAAWREWMQAEVECQTEAEFYFGGLTEEGKAMAAQKIAANTCVTSAKRLSAPN